jgi:hypothetical protein
VAASAAAAAARGDAAAAAAAMAEAVTRSLRFLFGRAVTPGCQIGYMDGSMLAVINWCLTTK